MNYTNFMNFSNFLVFLLFFPALASSQSKPAYQLYNKEGKAVDYGHMLDLASQKMVVLFGELHNNPIAHWLQLELTASLHEKISPRTMVMGAEMFEADNQLIIDEYLSGLIPERNFRAEARLWNNYETDYRPLVEFAREHNIPFIASNIPRRYASLVHRQGFEGLEQLNEQAKLYIAPLPVAYEAELPAYKAMLSMEGMPAHGSENLPKAQAIKDATMAHFIYKNLDRHGVFIHFHGAYHSDNFEGIVWYLGQIDEKLPLMTITTVEQDNIDFLEEEYFGRADIIIVVPTSMTKTF